MSLSYIHMWSDKNIALQMSVMNIHMILIRGAGGQELDNLDDIRSG